MNPILDQARHRVQARLTERASRCGWLVTGLVVVMVIGMVARVVGRETVAVVRGAWWAARTVPALARLLLFSATVSWVVHAVWYAIPLTVGLAGLLVWPRVNTASFRARMAGPAQAVRLRQVWAGVAEACGLATTSSRGAHARAAAVRVPRITRATPSAQGVAVCVEVRTLPGQTPDDVIAAGPKIAAATGAVDHRVTPTGPATAAIDLITVDVLDDTLPARLPQPPVAHAGGQAALPAAVAVPETLTVGLTHTGTEWQLVTAAHTLTAGCTGSGKGSVMWSALTALAPAIHTGTLRVAGIDLKGGMELGLGRALFTDLATTAEQAVALLEHLAELMASRAARLAGIQRCHTPTIEDPAWLVLIDEMAVLTAYLGERDLRLRATRALSLLLTQGRAVAVTVWAFLQDPSKETLGMRDLFTQRVCLRMSEPTAAVMVLGDAARGTAPAHHINPGSPGTGYALGESARLQRVRATYLTDTQIRTLATHFPAPVEGVIVSVPAPRDNTGRQAPTTTTAAGAPDTNPPNTTHQPHPPRQPRAPRTARAARAPRSPRAARAQRAGQPPRADGAAVIVGPDCSAGPDLGIHP